MRGREVENLIEGLSTKLVHNVKNGLVGLLYGECSLWSWLS